METQDLLALIFGTLGAATGGVSLILGTRTAATTRQAKHIAAQAHELSLKLALSRQVRLQSETRPALATNQRRVFIVNQGEGMAYNVTATATHGSTVHTQSTDTLGPNEDLEIHGAPPVGVISVIYDLDPNPDPDQAHLQWKKTL